MVFYRKYRPQTISELDSELVRTKLSSILSARHIPHAFLFTGPKGLGKTSAARIVAKVINCIGRKSEVKGQRLEKPKHASEKNHPQYELFEPCNQCDVCISIINGTNVDVLEIDAASNRGIDEIRDLRDKVRLAPVTVKKKIYIIDEVHMLTTEAFNALLKTLEEPPEHVVFILATTEPQKVPETIISRCTHVAFHKATEEELVRSFKRILKGENLKASDKTLRMIASLSDGGFRDGAKILEEIAASAKDQTITEELIEGKYHLGTIGHFMKQFFVALYQQDLDMALSVIAQMGEQGVDFGFFIQQAIEVLHRMLLMNAGVKTEELASDFPRFNVLDIRELYELLVKAHIDMKYAVLAQMPLELAAVSWCARQEYEVERERNGTDVSDLRKKVGELKKQQALAAEAGNMMTKDSPSEVTKTSLFSYQGNGEPTHEWLATFWQALIRQMKSYNHTVSGVLRGCKVTAFTKEYLIITTAYAFHKDRLSEAKTLKALEEAVKVLTGKQMQVRIELKK